MATGGMDEPSDMECTICQNHFTLPKILPCGHLSCCHCIVKWLESKPDAGCPICRCAILEGQDKQAGRSVQEMVDDFPTDLAMAALVEAHSLLSKQHVCCMCRKSASALCLDCGDMFCPSCKAMHTNLSLAKHHKLEDLTNLTTETLAARRPAMCADHKEEACKVYCPTHGESVCLLCATTTHRQCQQVVSLQVRMKQSVAELDQLTALLTDGETKLDVSLEQLDKHIKDMNKRADDALQQIQAICQRLESALKDCRRRLEDMTRKARDDATQDANDVKAVLMSRRGKLTSHKTVTGRARSHSDICSVADVTGQLKTRITNLHGDATTTIGDKQVRSFTFTLDPEAVARIERELSQLGKVTFTPLTGVSVLSGVSTVTGVSVLQPTSIQFHQNHGSKICLSNNNQTVRKTSTGPYVFNGVVIVREPMEQKMLYEVVVDDVDPAQEQVMLGVLTTSPDSYVIQSHFYVNNKHVLCLNSTSSGYLYSFGTKTKDSRVGKLHGMKQGSHVGLALDDGRNVHLFLDGHDEGVVATNIPKPAHFVFDMHARCLQVTLQRLKAVDI